MSTTTERTRASAFGLNKESDCEESGAFPIRDRESLEELQLESDAVIAELSPDLVSLIPDPPKESLRPRAPTPSERAELVIEDLSLWPENPYLASSLVPPPKRPFPVGRAIAIAGGMLAAAAIGAVIQLNVLRAPHQPVHQHKAAAAAVTAPAKLVASPAEVVAPPAPVAVVPVAAPIAAVVVAPAAAAPAARVAAAPAAPVIAPKPAAIVARAEVAKPVAVKAVLPPAPPEPAAEVAAADVAPAVELPDYPTREQVTAGFESVRGALAQCAAGQAGTAQIKATIGANGRISYALVGGDFDGSPAGSCMAKAVRDAQFPAFAQPRLKVTYPFAL